MTSVLSYLIIAAVVVVFVLFVRFLSTFGQSRERRQYTYQQLAEDYDLWNTYVNDVDGDEERDMSRSAYSKLSTEEKIKILRERFGSEKRR